MDQVLWIIQSSSVVDWPRFVGMHGLHIQKLKHQESQHDTQTTLCTCVNPFLLNICSVRCCLFLKHLAPAEENKL